MENEAKQLEVANPLSSRSDYEADRVTALAWPDRARGLSIVDQPSYDNATALLVEIATIEDRIKKHHAPVKDAAFRAHKEAVAAEKRLLDPLKEAEGILKGAIKNWEDEQEIKRLKAQQEAEARQKQVEEEARLAVAVEAEQNGADAQTVEEILNRPVTLPTPVIAPTFQRANGVNTQQRWKAEVIDLKALCRAIADGHASQELVQPNMVALNGMARAMKQTMSIPGVRAVPETTVAVRRAV